MKKQFFNILAALALVASSLVPFANVSADDSTSAGQSKAKDVYIDNTVDNSYSFVTGVVHLTGDVGTLEGYNPGKTVYENSAAVTYSNPKTNAVQEMINAAREKVNSIAEAVKAKGSKGEFHISISESVGKIWDNRNYETVEDGDAALIGDADYLTGAYGVDGDYTRTHIASGDYGKYTYYRVEANGWISSGENTTTYDVTEGAEQTYTIGTDDTATFRVNADYSLFEPGGKVYVDSGLVSSDNYTSESGSTIITLAKDYMSSLSVGAHSFAVIFNDNGTAATNFTVAKAATSSDTIVNTATTATTTSATTTAVSASTTAATTNPNTADYIGIWVTLAAVSTLTFGLGMFGLKKSKK